MAEDTDPGGMLRWMTDGSRLHIDRWLRTENLEEDVMGMVEELGALNALVAERVRGVGRRNVAPDYDRNLASHFSAAQIRRMYARNPDWAEIERAAFGNLLCERSGARAAV